MKKYLKNTGNFISHKTNICIGNVKLPAKTAKEEVGD